MLAAPSVGLAAQKAEILQVAAGPLSGKLTTSNGLALADVQIRIMQDGKAIATAKTDKAGEYKVASLSAGRYQVAVGAEKVLEIEAIPDSRVTNLSFVIPQRDYAAAELTQTQWVWVIVGTAVVVAVAIPVLYNTTNVFGGGTHHSP